MLEFGALLKMEAIVRDEPEFTCTLVLQYFCFSQQEWIHYLLDTDARCVQPHIPIQNRMRLRKWYNKIGLVIHACSERV